MALPPRIIVFYIAPVFLLFGVTRFVTEIIGVTVMAQIIFFSSWTLIALISSVTIARLVNHAYKGYVWMLAGMFVIGLFNDAFLLGDAMWLDTVNLCVVGCGIITKYIISCLKS